MAWSSRNGNYWQSGVTLTKVSETDTSITLKYTALFRSDYRISVMSSITWDLSMSGAYTWSSSSGGEAEGEYITSENDTSVTLYTKEFTVNKTTSSQTVTAKNTVKVTSVSSGTQTASTSYTIPAKTSYTVSYNANGGSGAPSSQTKWHGTTLTLSSTKPTRTGYTFKGWALSKADADGGTWYYQAGGSCGKNENLTLYATWEEHKLTINYYSNYATSAFADAENTVGSDKNVKVWTGEVYYDNDYSTYGLANYSNSTGSVYMTRTGYTATGNWGTSTSGGTLINENTGYATGQAIAKALGKDLSSGSASINLYAQWTENYLTINYYSNYADYGTFNGESLSVSASSNVNVYSHKYYYDNAYNDGLYNIQNSEKLYLSRTGYTSTLHWGTSESGGTLIDQYTTFATGQALAKALGKDISNGNASINIYAQWRPNVLTIKYNVNGGKVNSDKYYISDNLIALTSSSSVLEDKWNYNNGHTDGLYNASTFGLSREGYKFIGWKVGSSGATVFDQDDSSVVPTDLASNLTTGDRTVTLYAVWEISGVVYIDNGTTFEPYLVYIDNGTSWDLYLAYVDNGTDWDIVS